MGNTRTIQQVVEDAARWLRVRPEQVVSRFEQKTLQKRCLFKPGARALHALCADRYLPWVTLSRSLGFLSSYVGSIIVDLAEPSSAPHKVSTIIPQAVVPFQTLRTLQPLIADKTYNEREPTSVLLAPSHRCSQIVLVKSLLGLHSYAAIHPLLTTSRLT